MMLKVSASRRFHISILSLSAASISAVWVSFARELLPSAGLPHQMPCLSYSPSLYSLIVWRRLANIALHEATDCRSRRRLWLPALFSYVGYLMLRAILGAERLLWLCRRLSNKWAFHQPNKHSRLKMIFIRITHDKDNPPRSSQMNGLSFSRSSHSTTYSRAHAHQSVTKFMSKRRQPWRGWKWSMPLRRWSSVTNFTVRVSAII